jgi:hypothetical protein
MRGMSRQFLYRIASAAVVLAGSCILFAHVSAQDSAQPAGQAAQAGQAGQGRGGRGGPRGIPGGYNPSGYNMHVLPPGGPAPRLSDGHVDFTGRYYPNSGGRMLDSATPGNVDPLAFRQFDPKVTPEEKLSWKPGMEAKYMSPVPYGICDQAGTPSAWTMQDNQHAPLELISSPSRVVLLTEYPLDVRMIYMNRPHPKDPDPTFNGDSSAHWEGDTLVVDVIALDDRLRNVAVGGFSGEGNAWLHSPMEHILERWTRPSKNYLTYQITIEDPLILTKPWTSAPRKWSLVADPKEEWGEVFCTHNEEPDEWKHIDNGVKDDYENKYKK